VIVEIPQHFAGHVAGCHRESRVLMDSLRLILPECRRAWLLVFALALVPVFTPKNLWAEDWMFRRSYYSHARPPEHIAQFPPPERRTAYRPAIAGVTPGFAIRGAYRYNRIQLGQGRNADVTIYRQDWFELEP
jgi:hypothetical protein